MLKLCLYRSSGVNFNCWLKFIFWWFIETGTVTLDLTIMENTSSLRAPHHCHALPTCLSLLMESPAVLNAVESTSYIRKSWPDTFKVPWQRMHAEIQSAISPGKRPSPAARRQMIRDNPNTCTVSYHL